MIHSSSSIGGNTADIGEKIIQNLENKKSKPYELKKLIK